ncbi:hypothetical protein DCC81_10640 [Chitinophaga parva]|uniref:Uncharacterized protein n=1 Tax=Chitinophaga parva TaxID=2169414 RepID=A0A2T7BET0_9BACT|nr:hypothetical protein [Chitinophaga parva]PUZ24784.1 hypothetical protein DCC81_10640 [Chitinophaga parva]
MEKINALIDKLAELKNSNAGLQTIAYYSQLLQSEIFRAQLASSDTYSNVSSNIAVILPASRIEAAIDTTAPAVMAAPAASQPAINATVVQPAAAPTAHSNGNATVVMPAAKAAPVAPADKPAIPQDHEKWTGKTETPAAATAIPAAPIPAPTAAPDTAPHSAPGYVPPAANAPREMQPERPNERAFVTVNSEDLQPEPPKKHTSLFQDHEPEPLVPNRPKTIVGKNGVPGNTLFDTPAPTQQPSGIRSELHELAGKNMASLNDRLRTSKTELGEKLGDNKVADLRQAIGINDKFRFIQELFRGDVDMYERSVRTINEFRSYQEADMWIHRELKIKLGWLDDNPSVQHFYVLLKKRFG